MKNTLYVLRYTKRHLSGRSDEKPVALAVIELRLSEGISQPVSQSVENSSNEFFFKKSVVVDLEACSGFILPNQYCQIVVREK